MKKAIITGIAGQDGAFLANHLLNLGYKVIGADRRRVDQAYTNLDFFGIRTQIELKYFDLLEYSNIESLIRAEKPDEFYNLAAQSFVQASFDMPILTSEVDAMGVLKILEAIRRYSPNTRFYQASTSEMFGKVQAIPQIESTPFYPRSPYGVAKLYGHWMTVNYRESFDLYACSGILFNHESELRGGEFVTQKIVRHVCSNQKNNKNTPLELGNLDAKRDWGYAGDYVKAMHLMLQQEKAEDFVIATNRTTSIRKFVEMVYEHFHINIRWEGEGVNEVGINSNNGDLLVKISPKYYRPAEVDLLIGDSNKAQTKLGWKLETSLEEMISKMIKHASK